jgi:hypothetical protein
MIARLATRNVLAGATLALALFAAARPAQRPKTVIQMVTIKWTAEAAPELRRAALDGVEKMAAEIPGVRNVWLRTIRVQPRDFLTAFAIEFEDQPSAERYARHPAHEAWNKSFLPLIEESRVQQVGN